MELCVGLSHLPLRHRIHPLLHGHPELRSTPGVATQDGFGPEFAGHGIPQGLDTLAWLWVMHHICRAAHHLPVPHPDLSKAFPNICLCFLHRVFKKTSPNSKVSLCALSPDVPCPLVCLAQGLGCAGISLGWICPQDPGWV